MALSCCRCVSLVCVAESCFRNPIASTSDTLVWYSISVYDCAACYDWRRCTELSVANEKQRSFGAGSICLQTTERRKQNQKTTVKGRFSGSGHLRMRYGSGDSSFCTNARLSHSHHDQVRESAHLLLVALQHPLWLDKLHARRFTHSIVKVTVPEITTSISALASVVENAPLG